MNKHALMLTAATVALLAGPAFATTSITQKVTTAQKTSTANNGNPDDISIDSGGSVELSAAGPAVEIDSGNTVTLSVAGAPEADFFLLFFLLAIVEPPVFIPLRLRP